MSELAVVIFTEITLLITIALIVWFSIKMIYVPQPPEPFIDFELLQSLRDTQQFPPYRKEPAPRKKPTSQPEHKPEPPKSEPAPPPKPIWPGVREDVRSKKHKVYAAERIFSFDKKFLQENEYSSYWFVPLGKVRQREFYIAPSKNESPLHMFLVWSACRLLRKACVTKIEPPDSDKPDIVFTKFKRTYAIEIETNRSINRDRILKKIQANNKDYGKRSWFFLAAASKQVKLYQRYASAMSRNQFAQWVKTLK